MMSNLIFEISEKCSSLQQRQRSAYEGVGVKIKKMIGIYPEGLNVNIIRRQGSKLKNDRKGRTRLWLSSGKSAILTR